MSNSSQYSAEGIHKYEVIFGRNFVSTGGPLTTRQILNGLDLKPGLKVLDIGCGLGGSAFLMAREYGATVHGVDLSENMIHIAKARRAEAGLETQVRLTQGDCLELQEIDTYNLVYSRDAFLHIHDKVRLLAVVRRVLVPGGRLFFSDYCWGGAPKRPDFAAYVKQRNYDLHTVEDYGNLLRQAGFRHVDAQDQTLLFVKILQREIANLPVDQLTPADVDELTESWHKKIGWAKAGNQSWGWFSAWKSG